MRKTWERYAEDLYNVEKEVRVKVNILFYYTRRGNSYGEGPVSKSEMEAVIEDRKLCMKAG